MLEKIKNFSRTLRRWLVKIIFDKYKKSNIILDMNKVKVILFLRDDNKIGDMVISTILFRELKKKYSNIKIFVLCGKANKEVIKYNPYIDKIFEVKRNLIIDFFIYKKLRKYKIDVVVDFFLFKPRLEHMAMLRIINPCFLIGFHKQGYNIYNFYLKSDYDNTHIVNMYIELLHFLGVDNISINYDVYLSEYEEKYAKEIKENYKSSKLIFFNTYSASKYRTLSLNKIKELINLILYDKKFKIILNSNHNIDQNNNIFISKRRDVLSMMALVKYSDIILTTDTSIVHVANAFNKKMVALYLDDSYKKEKLSKVWAPNYGNAIQLIANTKSNFLCNKLDNISNKLIIETIQSI